MLDFHPTIRNKPESREHGVNLRSCMLSISHKILAGCPNLCCSIWFLMNVVDYFAVLHGSSSFIMLTSLVPSFSFPATWLFLCFTYELPASCLLQSLPIKGLSWLRIKGWFTIFYCILLVDLQHSVPNILYWFQLKLLRFWFCRYFGCFVCIGYYYLYVFKEDNTEHWSFTLNWHLVSSIVVVWFSEYW